jgi:hypothetical protein
VRCQVTILLRGPGKDLGPIVAVLEHRLDDALDPPVEAAEDDGYRLAFGASERLGGVCAVVRSGCRGMVSSVRAGPIRYMPLPVAHAGLLDVIVVQTVFNEPDFFRPRFALDAWTR